MCCGWRNDGWKVIFEKKNIIACLSCIFTDNNFDIQMFPLKLIHIITLNECVFYFNAESLLFVKFMCRSFLQTTPSFSWGAVSASSVMTPADPLKSGKACWDVRYTNNTDIPAPSKEKFCVCLAWAVCVVCERTGWSRGIEDEVWYFWECQHLRQCSLWAVSSVSAPLRLLWIPLLLFTESHISHTLHTQTIP